LGTVATGINNKGTIVAYYFVNSTGTLGSVMTTNNGKTFKKINVPGAGALGSGPLDINNENDVSSGSIAPDCTTVPCSTGGSTLNSTIPRPMKPTVAGSTTRAWSLEGTYLRAARLCKASTQLSSNF
jgi:hypothetical protein